MSEEEVQQLDIKNIQQACDILFEEFQRMADWFQKGVGGDKLHAQKLLLYAFAGKLGLLELKEKILEESKNEH